VWGVLLCGLPGCTTQRIDALVQAANDREWKTCAKIAGAYGLFASASIEIAAGGATIEQCRGAAPVRAFTIQEIPP